VEAVHGQTGEDGKLKEYQVRLKVAFKLKHERAAAAQQPQNQSKKKKGHGLVNPAMSLLLWIIARQRAIAPCPDLSPLRQRRRHQYQFQPSLPSFVSTPNSWRQSRSRASPWAGLMVNACSRATSSPRWGSPKR